MRERSSLLQSYLTTRYLVDRQPLRRVLVLRVGVREPALARLQSRAGCRYSAYITAWNPRSLAQTRKRNETAQRRLVRVLEKRSGIRLLRGEGVAANGAWREPSVLALGLARPAALQLARRFRQNAVLICDKRGLPHLVLLRPAIQRPAAPAAGRIGVRSGGRALSAHQQKIL